jgi:hypothetical protein
VRNRAGLASAGSGKNADGAASGQGHLALLRIETRQQRFRAVSLVILSRPDASR